MHPAKAVPISNACFLPVSCGVAKIGGYEEEK
jgi:hypothetical protein